MLAAKLAIDGLPLVAVLVLLGESVVVVHRASSITNFASASLGVVSAYVFSDIWPSSGLPWPLALAIALAAGGALGAVAYLAVMRQLANASQSSKVIATLGVMILVQGLSDEYFAPGGSVRSVRSFLTLPTIHLGGGVDVSGPILLLVIAAVVVSAALLTVERRTRFGLATLAVGESGAVAATFGVSTDVIATLNWAAGAMISGLGLILLAPISGMSPDSMTLLIVPALGAALVGRFDSIPWTIVGALVLGLGEGEVGLFTSAPGWADSVPLIFVVVMLAVMRPLRTDRSETGRRLPRVTAGGTGWTLLAAAALLALLVGSLPLPWVSALTTTMTIAVVLLSIVILTGFAGQLSLAQLGIAGLGAYGTTFFAMKLGFPPLVAMVGSIALTVPIALIVGAAALRVRDTALAIASLMLLVVIENLLLTNSSAIGWLGFGEMPSLNIFGYDLNPLAHPRVFGFVIAAVLIVIARIAGNLRRSTLGRRMLAVRSNGQAAASVGISPWSTTLGAFAMSACIAALGGALIEFGLSYPSFTVFGEQTSITAMLQSVVTGVGFPSGAGIAGAGIPGGVIPQIVGHFVQPSNWITIVTALAVLVTLRQSPDGAVPLLGRQLAFLHRLLPKGWAGARDLSRGGTVSRRGGDAFQVAMGRPVIRSRRRRASALKLDRATVVFGGIKALDDVSLSVEPGQIVGLIGPNGAGKSTLIDAVSGAQCLASGSISLDGAPLDRLSAARRAKRGIARSFQSLELFEDMSVGENLLVASDPSGRWRQLRALIWPSHPETTEAAVAAVTEFGLVPHLTASPRALDHGKRRLVAIVRTLACDPAVVLLDEPAVGLDAGERDELCDLLCRVTGEWGIGVLLVEHDVDLVCRVSDHVVALVNGRIVAAGEPDAVRANPVVATAYLGYSSDVSGGPDAGGIDATASLSTRGE